MSSGYLVSTSANTCWVVSETGGSTTPWQFNDKKAAMDKARDLARSGKVATVYKKVVTVQAKVEEVKSNG